MVYINIKPNYMKKYKKRNKVGDIGRQHMREAQKAYQEKLANEKYKDFDKHITIDKRDYVIKDYCEHGNLRIKIYEFFKIYNEAEVKIYCDKCRDEYIKNFIPTEEQLKHYKEKIQTFYIHNEQLVKRMFLNFYSTIFWWSKKYDKITFRERVYLFKNNIKNIPTCEHDGCKNPCEFLYNSNRYMYHCKKHMYVAYSSKSEREIRNFIEQYIPKKLIEYNYRKDKKEFDIFIPSLNLAIEHNGLYTHSEIKKDKNYHYDKWKYCRDRGIKLLTIWEDQWLNKKDIIKSIILSNLKKLENKIYARKCEIRECNIKESRDFLEKNHIQGYCSSKIKLGLFYNNELVSLMTFGYPRFAKKKKETIELLRFCSKLNTNVIGAASKLFSYYKKHYENKNIISYANCDISNGSLYRTLGFTEIAHTGINYWWTDYNKRYHRMTFMKKKLVAKGNDNNKTESEIMRSNRFSKIYGTGNILYEYIF